MQTAQMTRKRYPTEQKSHFMNKDFRMIAGWCVIIYIHRIGVRLVHGFHFNRSEFCSRRGQSVWYPRQSSHTNFHSFLFPPLFSLLLYFPLHTLSLPNRDLRTASGT